MKLLASLAVVLCEATAAAVDGTCHVPTTFQTALPAKGPHPAVVRVIVPDGYGTSFGSGALVAVNQQHGLVVTNWHVVRDAAGQIVVVFPDGFRSGATVLSTDPDWDLAALAIWRPNVKPIPLATYAPRPGELLTIAGYGSGQYRTITGRCTQYVSPGSNEPFEMVELSAQARNGDSGGPIFNSQGQLAGVLFGAAFGQTTGSYCGRVGRFLASVTDEFQHAAGSGIMIAQRAEPTAGAVYDGWEPSRDISAVQTPAALPPTAAIAPRTSPPDGPNPSQQRPLAPEVGWATSPLEPDTNRSAATSEAGEPIGVDGTTRLDRIKTILAAIGLFAIFFHGVRLLSMAERS